MTHTPSPYAHILRAIADGETRFQIIPLQSDGTWQPCNASQMLEMIQRRRIPPEHMRVEPRIIRINGHEVPEPLREMPPDGTLVFWPSFGPNARHDMAEGIDAGHYLDHTQVMLKRGMLHLTPEAAAAHAQALISFTSTV